MRRRLKNFLHNKSTRHDPQGREGVQESVPPQLSGTLDNYTIINDGNNDEN